jgi:hypothetical protein
MEFGPPSLHAFSFSVIVWIVLLVESLVVNLFFTFSCMGGVEGRCKTLPCSTEMAPTIPTHTHTHTPDRPRESPLPASLQSLAPPLSHLPPPLQPPGRNQSPSPPSFPSPPLPPLYSPAAPSPSLSIPSKRRLVSPHQQNPLASRRPLNQVKTLRASCGARRRRRGEQARGRCP